MPNTFTKLASYTVTNAGGDNPIAFTSIPQTYTDLVIQMSVRGAWTGGYDSLGMYFNGLQSNISNNSLGSNGTSAFTGRSTYRALATLNTELNSPSVFSIVTITIPNYSGSTFKQIMVENIVETTGTVAYPVMVSQLWSNTAAITGVSFDTGTSGLTLVQKSTVSLYGINGTP
jgi:hypothetical protein